MSPQVPQPEPGDAEPIVDLPVHKVACSACGEPFRDRFPKGWLPFALAIVHAFANDDSPAARARAARHAGDFPATVDAAWPLCSTVPVATRRSAYLESGIGTIARCDVCGVPGIGAPCTYTLPRGTRRFDHVCFECVLKSGERLHRDRRAMRAERRRAK